MRKIGKIRERLAVILSEALTAHLGSEIEVDASDFWIQEGAYRSLHWDLARWGGSIPIGVGSLRLSVHSWDTMTECVRNGVEIIKPIRSGPWELEISVKEPKTSPTAPGEPR